ncbi:hypothetical protein [Parasediminibacterium sp. JCM 36343]|uniref:hypothetical protein n=1 Tax=Parasediminibacterium sp. JCM 36343 TaxID=3374279 RepID=UPI0039792EF4
MGARFIAGTVQGSTGLKNCKAKNDTEFSFEYQSAGDEFKSYKVYVPTREDYEVSVEVIDRALSQGYNLIVYDSWIFATHSGKDYAGVQRIPIFSVPAFIKTLKSRQKFERE